MVNISAQNQDELSRILDSCLDQITNGSETVDSIVEQYPIYKEQLRPALEAAQWLQSRKEVFNPRPGFVQLSHRRLVNRFRNNSSRVAAAPTETKNWLLGLFQERRLVVQYSALLTLTAVLLFVGYRSTSFLIQRSIPGDPLYDTKLAQEELLVSLSRSEKEQTRLRIEFAQRRVVEMQELVLSGRDMYLDETLANFKFQMNDAASGLLSLAKSDPKEATTLSAYFEETITDPVKNLVGILDTAPEFASAGLVDSLNTLTAEIFGQPVTNPVLVLATTTPTSTSTATLTPTQTFTATFTATSTTLTESTPTLVTPTYIPPTKTPRPTSPPPPTNTAEPRSNPEPEPTIEPTSAPPPTVAPADTQPPQPPPPSDSPEPPPEKTKKPKPTQHPTYQP
jgi:hypothetical protein